MSAVTLKPTYTAVIDDALKIVFAFLIVGLMVSLVLYNFETSGEHFIVIRVGIVIIGIFGIYIMIRAYNQQSQ